MKQPNLTEKLASALLMLTDETGALLVDREQAKGMSAAQIVGLFEFDHGVHRAIEGTNHPTNLTPRIYAEHRAKTNKQDIPQIAKTKRISKEQEEFRARLLRKVGGNAAPKPRGKLRSRPMPKAPAGHKHFRRSHV